MNKLKKIGLAFYCGSFVAMIIFMISSLVVGLVQGNLFDRPANIEELRACFALFLFLVAIFNTVVFYSLDEKQNDKRRTKPRRKSKNSS